MFVRWRREKTAVPRPQPNRKPTKNLQSLGRGKTGENSAAHSASAVIPARKPSLGWRPPELPGRKIRSWRPEAPLPREKNSSNKNARFATAQPEKETGLKPKR